MKKILLLTLIYIFQSFYSFGSDDWITFGKNQRGTVFFYKNVKYHNGTIFYERMLDYLKPGKNSELCVWSYREVNCNNLSWKDLNFQSYRRPLCQGEKMIPQKLVSKFLSKQNWRTNKPGQIDYNIHKKLCDNYK